MTTERIDVLAVMDALMSAASDTVDTNDAGNYMELPDERHEVLEARYGSVPRSQMVGYALTRLFNAREDAVAARAAVAELIERERVMREALRRIADGEHREGATDGQIVSQMMQTAETALARVGGA